MKLFNDNNSGYRQPQAACILVVAVLLLPAVVYAREADQLDAGRVSDADFGVWTQAGSVSTTLLSCIASANDDSPNPKDAGARQMPYQMKVESMGGDTDFYLYLGGDTGNTGNRRIGITLSHRDVNDGGLFETLSHSVYDSHAHVGGFKNCVMDGDNSELSIGIDGSELAAKVSGSYSGTFLLTAVGGSSGSAIDSETFSISITIQSSPDVMISGLDNLSMGTHSGLGDIYAEENFCVYSSSGTGSYNMTISSVNQDGSGHFFLVNAGGLGQIAYELAFTDQGSGPGTVQVSSATLSGFGDAGDPTCNGTNNATLSVSVAERDLQMAKSGAYNDSLVILVEPQ